MLIAIQEILSSLIEDYKAGLFSLDFEITSAQDPGLHMKQTLVSCLLSSGWMYEKAERASKLFTQEFLQEGNTLPNAEAIENFLRDARVRHRFPRTKARQLYHSLKNFSLFPSSTLSLPGSLPSERKIRDALQAILPGFGYKQTSMFMRNVGASKNLAIIDSHILWYLQNIEGIQIGNLDQRKYLEIEDLIHRITEKHDVDINGFDLILWVLVRQYKKMEKGRSCEMQYVLPLAA
jgi:N-glycosylase/DNA lyase